MLLMVIAIGAKAQDKAPTEKADFANWVIESNVKTPNISMVKFYNAEQELIYQEEITGKVINVNRAKTRNKLNQLLAELVERDTQITSKNLVAVSLNRN